jgi:hypothetical protein
MPTFAGTLNVPPIGVTRVAAVTADGMVTAEAAADLNGAWTLQTEAAPEWIIASLSGRGVAAVATRPDDAASLRFPPLMELQLSFPDAPPHIPVSIDPIDLEAFPSDLHGALTLHVQAIVNLHVATIPGEGTQRVQLQRGTYRISGRTFTLRPDFGETFVLDRIVDEESGAVLPATNGEVVVRVAKNAVFRAHFAQA